MSFLRPNDLTAPTRVSSSFGWCNLASPLVSRFHRGMDFYSFPTVHPTADGAVVYVGWNTGGGWSTAAGLMAWVLSAGQLRLWRSYRRQHGACAGR